MLIFSLGVFIVFVYLLYSVIVIYFRSREAMNNIDKKLQEMKRLNMEYMRIKELD